MQSTLTTATHEHCLLYTTTQLHVSHLQGNSIQAYHFLVSHLSGTSVCFTAEVFLPVLGFSGVDVLDIKADSLQVADSEVFSSAGLHFFFTTSSALSVGCITPEYSIKAWGKSQDYHMYHVSVKT